MPYGPAFSSLPLAAATPTKPATRFIDQAAYEALLDNWVNAKADKNMAGFSLLDMGRATARDGSAVAPAFAFTNSLATGLFRAGANVLGLASNGVSRVEIGATGILTRLITDAQTAILNDQLQEVLSFKNTNATVNNWMTLTFYSSGNAAAASISSQMISHASSYADIVLATRGSDGYQIRSRVLSSGHVVVSSGKFRITGIPTSSAGLSSGDVWSNSGVLTIVS